MATTSKFDFGLINDQIKTHTDQIGNVSLPTTAQTLTGAIAENYESIGELNTFNYGYDNTFITLNSGLAIRDNIEVVMWKHVVLLRCLLHKTDESAFTGARVDVGYITNIRYKPIITVDVPITASTGINNLLNRKANLLIANGSIYIDIVEQDIKEFTIYAMYLI